MKVDDYVLIIFTRSPVPGRVNTRLIPAIGEKVAAQLHLELLRRTLTTGAGSVMSHVRLYCTPDTDHPELAGLAKEFGVTLYDQHGRDLGERMGNALDDALQYYKGAVLVGCDVPELSPGDLETACRHLCSGCDAVLGPAEDGGFYPIGLSRPCPELFDGMDWGRGEVLAEMRRRMHCLGLSCRELPERWDVDRPRDLIRYREDFKTRINLAGKY